MSSAAESSKLSGTPGTWDVATGKAVNWADAVHGWAVGATPVLMNVAATYDRTITYTELIEAIQASSGVRTRSLYWARPVLEEVALDCLKRGDVLLTALCVHSDGTVGEGYAVAASYFMDGVEPENAELHAADTSLLCYQKYATDLPADGGRPSLTPQESARRKAKAPEPAPKMCPIHYTVLPRTGICDECALDV